MVHRLTGGLDRLLERRLPERRVFLRSDSETRFLRLRPSTQAFALAGLAAIVGWAIIATSILVLDSIGGGNWRAQAERDRQAFETRLAQLVADRDRRAAEALAAQNRFAAALEQIARLQTSILAGEGQRRELEAALAGLRASLARENAERKAMEGRLAALSRRLSQTIAAARASDPDTAAARAANEDRAATLALLAETLEDTAAERDRLAEQARTARERVNAMRAELKVVQARNEQIFRQLEEAVTLSMAPLDKMFRKVGLDTDKLLRDVKKSYSGQGGPLMPLAVSTRGAAAPEETMRVNRLMGELDHLNMMRIAAEKLPFSLPVRNSFRYTSGFGMRWGRMHKGTDMAAPMGTPIYATADGVVTHAGWASGYGRLIKIRHAYGVETRYAHLSRIRVRVGQKVSRGQRIGDMGNSGRSTGTHLHYEVRVGGRAINPMTYIRAAKDVF